MKPGIPWSVKGIEPEVREAAKVAARRSGMTLGEWLNNVILEQSDDAPPAPVRPAPRHEEPRSAVRLEDIAEQLARIARREHDTTPSPYAGSRQADQEALSRILNRVESNERQTVEAFSAVNERLSAMGRQISRAAPAAPALKPEETPAFQSLEKAVRNIIEHIETGERRTRDSLKTMQDRMAEMASRAAGSVNEQVLQQAPAIRSLEARISELASRIDRSETGHAMALPDILQRELADLAGRIDGVRNDSEALASRAQTAAVQASQKELRTIETRILSLLKDAQVTFASHNSTPAEMQRLRGEVDTLNKRIDSARTGLASDRDVTALRAAVEQLSTRVAQGQDMRPLADLDRRVSEIHQRLEQTQGSMAQKPQLVELERRMAEMDRRLSEAMTTGASPTAQSALENQIAAVAERLARTESQLASLDTIERAVNQLYDAMEQSRTTTARVAEETARRVAGEAGMHAAAPLSAMDPAPEIQALQDGLRAVRDSAATADQRNQETLTAVHDTLEQIVSKLAELENNAVGQQMASAMAAHVMAQPVLEDAPELPPASEIFAEPAPFENNPFTAPAAVETASETANPFAAAEVPPAPEPGSVDDIIAAARRMAQSSSAHKSVLTGLTPGNDKTVAQAGKKFWEKLPFLNRKPKDPKAARPAKAEKQAKPLKGSKVVPGVKPDGARQPPEIKPAANDNDARRKRLMLMGLLLLAAASAYTMNILGKPKSTPVTPAAIEQPAPTPEAPPAAAPAQPVIDGPQSQPSTEGSLNAPAPGIDAASPANGMMSPPADTVSPPPASGEVHGSLNPGKAQSIADLLASNTLTTATMTPPAVVENGAPPMEMPPAELGATPLRQSARDGDATAQFVIASRYLDGKVVAQDYAKAAEWYERAAMSGLAPAQYRLATLYERGNGVARDLAKALSWYEKAARQGNVRAMHNAAVIVAGDGLGKPDYTRAVYWFRQAADHGLKDSQFNLAVLIERGLGTVPSSSDALFWYTLAGQQKDNDAASRAAVLARSLSPAMVDDTKRRVASWQPRRSLDAANVVSVTRGDWQAASAPAEPASATAVANPDIAEIQTLLNGLGYKIGTPDGRMGNRTANAIRLFQMQNGFKVTGEATPELVAALKAKQS